MRSGDDVNRFWKIKILLKWTGFTLESFSNWISEGFSQKNYIQYLILTFLKNLYSYTNESKKNDVLMDAILESNIPIEILFESLSNMFGPEDFDEILFIGLLQNHEYKIIFEALSREKDFDETVFFHIQIFLLHFCMILHDIYTNICISNNASKNENTLSILYYGHDHGISLGKIFIQNGYIKRNQLTIPISHGNVSRCIDLEKAGFYFDVEEFLQR